MALSTGGPYPGAHSVHSATSSPRTPVMPVRVAFLR